MSNAIALFLGIIQGLTEFLPISSSGHLRLAEQLMYGKQAPLLFDIVCHLGTLLAIVCYFWRDLWTLRFVDWKPIAWGTLPLVLAVPFVKPLATLYLQSSFLGVSFLLTALLLCGGEIARWSYQEAFPLGSSTTTDRMAVHPFVIGLFQVMALLPGVSRSGATIAGAQIVGWHPTKAIRFSFFLAIPAILGATLVELVRLPANGGIPSMIPLLIGFATSFGVGLIALWLLLRIVQRWGLLPFAVYCLAIGVLCLFR